MKVTLDQPTNYFEPFSVRIDIENKDQLIALTMAAGRMCNGHGNDLYDQLVRKASELKILLTSDI